MKVIIFKNDNGGVSVIYPTKEALDIYGIDLIAKKDVPQGKLYRIANIEELPLDGTFNEQGVPNVDNSLRDRWDIDDSELTDGVGSAFDTFEGVINELN